MTTSTHLASSTSQSSDFFTEQDHYWMNQALQLAKQAELRGEVPVGAVLIQDEKKIGEGFNCPISQNDPTAHAEIIALRAGATAIQNYRILNSTLYVTLEPCMMCVGAIVQARITRVVFGAFDNKTGNLNHHAHFHGGLLSVECSMLLTRFFQERR